MEFINTFIKTAFIENLVLSYFLGKCSYLAVSKSVKTAFGLGMAVIFVLGITMPINWLINEYLLSENGLFGDEEGRIIQPAIRQAKKQGIACTGPHPADTLFGKAVRGSFDGIVALYHDQGLIPLKTVAFGHCVNITVGLPIIRTSVDHGTAYDIAGQGMADPMSLVEAIEMAAKLATHSP